MHNVEKFTQDMKSSRFVKTSYISMHHIVLNIISFRSRVHQYLTDVTMYTYIHVPTVVLDDEARFDSH